MAKLVANFGAEDGGQHVEIKRLTPSEDDARAYARAIQGVLYRSWEKRFSRELQPARTTSAKIKERFNPEKSGHFFRQQNEILMSDRENVAFYAAELVTRTTSEVIGIGKVTSTQPANLIRRIRDGSNYPYPHINEVAVDPKFQKRGVGSALVLSMLKGFGAKKIASIDAIESNIPVVEWLKEITFVPQERRMVPELLGPDTVVNEIHFEAPSVAGVRAAILDKHPNLSEVA